MTADVLLALSLDPGLSRLNLAERIRSEDPELLDRAAPWLDAAKRARDRAAADGIRVVTLGDPRFPAALLTLPDLPPALWYRGDLTVLGRTAVSVVGSRAASAVGMETAARLAEGLARAGVVVVSGLARGIDSAAHKGALAAGPTAAVLGSGPDIIYPPEHRTLAAHIAESGLVLSEYPPGTAPLPFRFPQRNRLISGLSRAVVVIEAAENSGSLITAACALEQGREVMAVPGNVLSGRSRGAHALIRDGACIVERAEDVLQELGLLDARSGTRGKALSDGSDVGSGDPVLRVLEPGLAYDLDQICAATGLDGVRLLPVLMELELRQMVRRVTGGRFMRSA